MKSLDYLQNDFQRAEYLQNMLVATATGEGANNNDEYQSLRTHFLQAQFPAEIIPDFVRTRRDLGQFWQFIKFKVSTYRERREFIWESFSKLLSFVESKSLGVDIDESVKEKIKKYGTSAIHKEMQKALERKSSDPEGAITIARTILESICKFILEQKSIPYTESDDLSILYKKASACINLAQEQHSELVYKQILGGCAGIINGLGTLRNKFGDAHGSSDNKPKPSPRHAELAVNLSLSMSLFLLETYEHLNPKESQ